MARKTIGELEDELKRKDQRIEELREEIDEQRELIQRLREHAEDYQRSMESWCETFDMEVNENGMWKWKAFWGEYNKLIEDYNKLVRVLNQYLPLINREPRNVGRPLGATEPVRANVLRLHKQGMSLRGIAEELTLGFQTVRTIVAQKHRRDRTTRKHRQRLERIEIDRQQAAKWKRRKRTGDALPRRVNTFLKEGCELVKEAKGLGKN